MLLSTLHSYWTQLINERAACATANLPRIPSTDDFLFWDSFHNMPHYCRSANNTLSHSLLPHHKHLMEAHITHTHNCADSKPTTGPPTRTATHKANSPTQAWQSQIGKAPEFMTCHFRAFPPAPTGTSVSGTAPCPNSNSTYHCLVQTLQSHWFCMNHFIWLIFYNNSQDRYVIYLHFSDEFTGFKTFSLPRAIYLESDSAGTQSNAHGLWSLKLFLNEGGY